MSGLLLVVVTGPPAAGKTTFARELAKRCELPLVEKDALKEILFDSLGTGDRARSRDIGSAAFALLFDMLERLLSAGTSTVAEANFWADAAEGEFRRLPQSLILQVYVSIPPDLALERFTERASTSKRHAGHADIAAIPEVQHGLVSGRWRPLRIGGELVEVDGSYPFELEPIVQRVRTLSA